jgi:saccharopine dehydrogenase-like NADP-dependent oxidoreductase
MNILIVGAGAQGAPCAAILAKQPGVSHILLGASKARDAAAVRDRIGSPKVTAAQLDAREPATVIAAVRSTIGEVDVVIDLTPSFCSRQVMRAALTLGAHYVNTAACPEHLAQLIARQPLDLAAEFAAANLTALLSCGVSPGVVNICCRYFCDQLDTVERIEIRAGFHVPAQKEMIRTWTPTWSPEQQFFDFCDPPCLFHDGRHEHMPCFYEPETYDFGGNLGPVQLTHHAHDEQYSLPIFIGKGIQYCCYKYPFEPAVATFFATGFTPDRVVEVNGVKVKPVDVLMELLPRPVQITVLDPQIQAQLVPLIADTKAHILIKGTAGGQERIIRIESGAYLDMAAKALELFGSANVAVGYAAATAALLIADGKTKPGIVWPEELDAVRFITLTNTLGLTLNFTVS